MLKDRLDLIIKELGLSGRQFEKECGLPPGSYSSISDGVGANKLKQILIKYPQISLDWIIMGDGDMFKKNESQIEKMIKIRNESINYWILSPPSKRRSNY